MKRVVILISALIIILNTVTGLILTAYEEFQMLLNDYVIMFATIMMLIVNKKEDKIAYRVSLTLLVMVLSVIQFVIGSLSCNSVINNPFLFGILAIQVTEIVVVMVVKYFSKYA